MKKHGYVFLMPGLTFVLMLSGCEDMEKSVSKAAEDPKHLPAAYASVAGLICLLLAVFADWSLWRCLLNTVRYMGVICVGGGPLYWVGSNNTSASVALMVSGVASAVMVTLLFRSDFRKWSDSED